MCLLRVSRDLCNNQHHWRDHWSIDDKRKLILQNFQEGYRLNPIRSQFLERGDTIQVVQGQGTKLESLPKLWKYIAKFIIRHILLKKSLLH